MKLLLDECVTRYLKPDLTGHEVFTTEEAGFKGSRNGRLLEAAAGHFDILVTVDQNLRYQQNLENFAFAIIVLKATRSTYPMLKHLIPKALDALKKIRPGEIVIVS